MPWFKREEETYNEQMLREAGLDQPSPPTVPALDPGVAASIFGVGARRAEWEVFVTVEAPDIAGDAVEFAALPEGDLIVDEEQGDADLSPLADAVEREVKPPYRAVGRRQEGVLWAVGANRIVVRRLERDGDEFEDVEGGTVVRGKRLDGDLWEIREDHL